MTVLPLSRQQTRVTVFWVEKSVESSPKARVAGIYDAADPVPGARLHFVGNQPDIVVKRRRCVGPRRRQFVTSMAQRRIERKIDRARLHVEIA